jgi:hypothetical protein
MVAAPPRPRDPAKTPNPGNLYAATTNSRTARRSITFESGRRLRLRFLRNILIGLIGAAGQFQFKATIAQCRVDGWNEVLETYHVFVATSRGLISGDTPAAFQAGQVVAQTGLFRCAGARATFWAEQGLNALLGPLFGRRRSKKRWKADRLARSQRLTSKLPRRSGASRAARKRA